MLRGQEIVQLEYFFDADPGYGNALQVPITPDSMIDIQTTLALGGLGDGLHTLYVRARDTTGAWSFLQKRSFIKDSTATATNTNITGAEYFFDIDPGYGNGLPLTIVPGTDILVIDNLALNQLTDGIHTISVRCMNTFGHWSFMQKRSFIKDQYATGSPVAISEVEFYIDEDPGFGNGFSLSTSDSTYIVVDTVLDLTPLPVGIHTLCARVKNEIGHWSFATKRSFLFDDERVEYAQFKFDSIPAYADWTVSNPFEPDFDIVADFDFEGICDLDTGWYHIDARARRELSWWSKEYTDSIQIKDEYLQTGVVLDQFGDSIPLVDLNVQGVGNFQTGLHGEYEFFVPKCWGDTIHMARDSVYSSKKSYVFQNPVLDYSPHHILGDIDSTLYGYKCVNHSGNLPSETAYICEEESANVSATETVIDTGSVLGYLLHDGVNTLGTVYEWNFTGEFVNDGTIPQNEKLYISSIVGRPEGIFPIDIDHECTDILLSGMPVIFLNIRDSIFLQLDSMGSAEVLADTLLESDCSTCEISSFVLTQSVFGCEDFGLNSESLTVSNGMGDEGTCPLQVSVGDTISPTIMCRSDTLVHTDPEQCDYTIVDGLMDPIDIWDNCPTSLINDLTSTAVLDGADLTLGFHQIQWTVSDNHGNTASCLFEVTTEDHEIPEIICATPDLRVTDEDLCTYSVTDPSFDPTTVSDNCADFSYWNEFTGTSTLIGHTFEPGSHEITWIVDDDHGQRDTCYTTITVEDHQVPEITCATDGTRSTDPGVCTYTVDGGEFDPVFVGDNCTAFTFLNDSSMSNTLDAVILALGTQTITWTVNDGHGQTASCTVAITIEDNELPEIICPGGTSRDTDIDECTYQVQGNEFDPVSVTDNCTTFIWTNNLNNTASLISEDLPFGVNDIQWTVDDGHGNTASCQVSIDVQDSQGPQITCPSDITLDISSASCDTVYSYVPLISDNCSGTILSLLDGNGSGGAFSPGISTEMLQVEDIGGNTAACAFSVTVGIIPDLVSDTICYGDSILLEGMYQYLPGVYTDTLQNSLSCDSIVITTLDTTKYCIWPSEIVYVDSAAVGENTGVDWNNAYIDLQLALDITDRYLNAKQIWMAKGHYFPTTGTDRSKTFIMSDSTVIYGGFTGVESDTLDRDPVLNPVQLDGDIGTPGVHSDNSYHIILNPASNNAVRLDGVSIIHGNADGSEPEDQSGAGIANYGSIRLTNCQFTECISTGIGSIVLNNGLNAILTLDNVTAIGIMPAYIWNTDQAQLKVRGLFSIE